MSLVDLSIHTVEMCFSHYPSLAFAVAIRPSGWPCARSATHEVTWTLGSSTHRRQPPVLPLRTRADPFIMPAKCVWLFAATLAAFAAAEEEALTKSEVRSGVIIQDGEHPHRLHSWCVRAQAKTTEELPPKPPTPTFKSAVAETTSEDEVRPPTRSTEICHRLVAAQMCASS